MSKVEKKLNYKNIIRKHFDSLAPERQSWIKKSGSFYAEDIRCMKEFIVPNSKVLEIVT